MQEVHTGMPVAGVLLALCANEETQQVETPGAGEAAAPETQGSGETTPESAAGENGTKPEGDGQRKGGFQRRIDKLTREKAQLEQERELWRQQALGAKPKEQQAQPEPKVQPATGDAPRPKADDFETQAEYIDALTDWKLEQKDKQAEAQRKETEAKQQQETVEKAFKDREKTFAESTTDYADVIQEAIADEVPFSTALWEEVQDHEHGPALLYFLAKNPDQAERLSAMTPRAVAREIARMESKFVPQTTDGGDEHDTATPVTKAPKPPTPAAKSGGGNVQKDPGQMDYAEYEAWRKKQFPNLR